jgi:hypothetical protein
MQRLTRVLAWTFWLVLSGACARPVVDEDQQDAAQNVVDGQLPDEDAEPPLPTPDAGSGEPDAGRVEPAEAGENDAACVDADRDLVCDAEDNCPDAVNPDQADTDADGKGNVCDVEQEAGVGCSAEPVPASVMSGDAVISGVRVNGSESPARVSKGQSLSVSLTYAFSSCSFPIPGQPRFLLVGLEGQSAGECRPLIEVPCPTAVTASTTISITAPSRSGPAYVLVAGRQGFTCSESLSDAKRVAALCVE